MLKAILALGSASVTAVLISATSAFAGSITIETGVGGSDIQILNGRSESSFEYTVDGVQLDVFSDVAASANFHLVDGNLTVNGSAGSQVVDPAIAITSSVKHETGEGFTTFDFTGSQWSNTTSWTVEQNTLGR